jgi:hypothetical protein
MMRDDTTIDLTLAELDSDGAIGETLDAAVGESRSSLLEKALVGSAGLLGALALPGRVEAARPDIAILNYALTLEYLQAAFYTEAERIGAVGGELARVPPQLGSVERAHVTALQNVLGRAAVKRPAFNFRGISEDQAAFLRTAVAFEDLGVAAYKGQATRLSSPGLLAAAVSIHSVEARHAAWMRYLAGSPPAATAFDEPKPASEVRAIVRSTRFITASPRRTAGRKPRFTG